MTEQPRESDVVTVELDREAAEWLLEYMQFMTATAVALNPLHGRAYKVIGQGLIEVALRKALSDD